MLAAASAIALTAALSSAPAAAQDACELDGTSTTSSFPSANSLTCGTNATTLGSDTTAIGVDAYAFFDGSTAIGGDSFAHIGGHFGPIPLLSEPDPAIAGATAVGSQTYAFGFGAVAVGAQAGIGTLTDNGGGTGSLTGFNFTTAIGALSRITAAGGTAIGYDSTVTAANSTVLGLNASDGGFGNVVTLGANTTATAANQVNVGNRTIGSLAAGVAASDAVNLGQMNAAIAALPSGDEPFFDANSSYAPAAATGSAPRSAQPRSTSRRTRVTSCRSATPPPRSSRCSSPASSSASRTSTRAR